MTEEEIRDQLDGIATSEDFASECEAIVDHWIESSVGLEAVRPVLKFMEEHGDLDFGLPGSLVRFVEKFYRHGYEEILLESLGEVPTTHTLWMLNRIINGTKDPATKERYVRILEGIQNTATSPEVSKEAQHYHDLHVASQ